MVPNSISKIIILRVLPLKSKFAQSFSYFVLKIRYQLQIVFNLALSLLIICVSTLSIDKIACTRCLAIQSSFTLGEDEDLDTDNDIQSTDSGCDTFGSDEEQSHHSAINCTNCTDCQYRRQIAVLDSLPDAVVQGMLPLQSLLDH